MSVTAIAFWVVYVVGLVAAVFSPVVGIGLYILVYHLNPETQWWGGAVKSLGLRTSLIVAGATTAGVLIRLPRLEHGARQFPLPYVLMIVLALMAAGSLAWGVGIPARGLYNVEKFIKLLLFVLLLLRCVRTPREYQLVVYAWLVGVLYLGYYARGGVGMSVSGRLTAGLGGPDFAESSGLAAHMVATLPLVGAAFFMARRWWSRLGLLVIGALTVDTIIMTRTRSALFGLGTMTVVGLLSLPRRYRVRGTVAVVVGLVFALQLTDPGWWARMSTIRQYETDIAAVQRITLWKAAVAMAGDYPFGVGVGNYQDLVQNYVPGLTTIRSTHNTPLLCLAELGVLGLLLFVSILGVTALRLRRTRRIALGLPALVDISCFRWQTRFHLNWHAMALKTALAGYLTCAMFTTRLFSEDMWILLGLAACLHNVALYMAGEHACTQPVRNTPSGAPGMARDECFDAVPAGDVAHAAAVR